MKVCPNCGEENPERFRLCGFCGTPLAVALPPQEVRKTVTIVFSDLKGSTNLGEKLDSEALREVMARYFDEMRAALEQHGGVVEKYIGDAIMAVFGLPRVHEDDAMRAVRAAAAMQEALAALNGELEERWGVTLTNRTGVNTGEVVAGDPTAGQRLVTGDAVNVAARLEQAAPAQQVLLGESTYRLVRDAVDVEAVEPLELKGKSMRVPAYRLVGVGDEAHGRVWESPLIGREAELALLADELRAAEDEAAARAVVLLAEPGGGKSRLIEEFTAAQAGAATFLRGRCLSYGRGITFWPVLEIVREAAAISDDDSPETARAKITTLVDGDARVVDRVAAAVGISDGEFPVEELFWGIRRAFEGIAADKPLVVVFEDVHWAEQTLLDLIEHVASTSRDVAILLVGTARPEFEEQRRGWFPRSRRVELRALTTDETERFVGELLGGAAVGGAVTRRIVDAAEGNPLFVEQMLSMLVDEGILRREGTRWTTSGDPDAIGVPATINALLAARLDLLSDEERAVIEPAAVIGATFERAAVQALVPETLREDVSRHLDALARRRLLSASDRAGDANVFRFQHILIRDAAYGSLLKRRRATLHEQFVDWAEAINRARDRMHEFEEILGYHLEQAHNYLAELGPVDEHGRTLARRASTMLASAGHRALGRSDTAAGANLVRRAVTLLPEEDPERVRLLPDLAEAMVEIGEFAWGEVYVEEAVAAATAAGDEELLAEAILTRLLVRHHATEDLDAWRAEVERAAENVIPELEERGAHAQLAKAWRTVAFTYAVTCRWEETAVAERRAIEHAREAGLARQEARASAAYTMALADGPMPVPEAIAECEEILARGFVDRQAEVIARCSLATLLAMSGEFATAREVCRDASELQRELGAVALAVHASLTLARIEMLAGTPHAVEGALRADDAALAAMGERYYRPIVLTALAQVVLQQDRHSEADAFAASALELAALDDVEAQALARGVRARVSAEAGRHEDARRIAEEAVALLRATDAVFMQTEALLNLAAVLRVAGEPDRARGALEQARACASRKRMSAPLATIHELLDALDAEAAEPASA